MDYRQAVDFVLSRTNFESDQSQVRYREFHLERVRHFLELLENPDRALPLVHVAGTKGKGSTVAMVASILSAAGYRTGRYTSPHLHTIRERIAIGEEPISERDFAAGVTALLPTVERADATSQFGKVTTFEILTALAFQYFRDQACTFAVIEVGLGGRLDATNVITPEAVGLTNISLDHTEILGSTLAKIASEKAAIIKSGVPVVSAPQPTEALAVITSTAIVAKAALTLAGRDITCQPGKTTLDSQLLTVSTATNTYTFALPLLGDFQHENAMVAIGLCEVLERRGHHVGKEAIERGLAQVGWPGRLEVLGRNPLLVTDGAHNPYSIGRMVAAVKASFSYARLIVVFGATRTKDLGGMLEELAQLRPTRLLAAQSRHPRSTPTAEIVAAAKRHGLTAEPASDTATALAQARRIAGPRDLILTTGSLFVVAETREAVNGITPELYPTFNGAMV